MADAANATEGRSMLAEMAAGIMAQKQAAVASLTPVEGEVKSMATVARKDDDMFAPPPRHELWAFVESLKDMVRTGELLLAALPASNAVPIEASAPPVDAAKAREKTADAKHAPEAPAEASVEEFSAKMAAMSAAAQAATFGDVAKQTSEKGLKGLVDGWVCPEHGVGADTTSRRGREYRKCPTEGCREFEKEG